MRIQGHMTKRGLTIAALSLGLFTATVSHAGGGGAFNGGGGGDASPDFPINRAVLNASASEAKQLLPFVIRPFESATFPAWSTGQSNEFATQKPDLYPKLFGKAYDPQTIYDIIPTVSFDLPPTGACIDPKTGELKDASAYIKNGQRVVCLSTERLAQKITFGTSRIRVTALIAHEVSHFLRTSEDEATSIQTYLESYLSNQTLYQARNSSHELVENFTDLERSLINTRNEFSQGNDHFITCSHLGRLTGKLQQVQNEQSKQVSQGYSLFDLRDQFSLIGLLLQAGVLEGYCVNNAFQEQMYGATFKGRPSIPLREFLKSTELKDDGELLDPQVKVHRVKFGDAKAAIAQVDEITKMVRKLLTSAKTAKQALVNTQGKSDVPVIACRPQHGYACVDHPGLYEEQKFDVQQDVSIALDGATYFVDGKKTRWDDLAGREGQSFCTMAVATDGMTPGYPRLLPKTLIQNDGSVIVPANLTPYKITSISWYVSLVFIGAKYNGEKLGLAIDCGVIRNRKIENETSLDAILRHFNGIITKL